MLSSTPALVCFRTNGKSEARTASAVHPMVAHHGRPVITCACSMAVAAMPTGSNEEDASINPLVAVTAASPEMVSPTRSVAESTVDVPATSAPFAPGSPLADPGHQPRAEALAANVRLKPSPPRATADDAARLSMLTRHVSRLTRA